ncbi:hypothetical protein ACFQE5_07675 [Pseudonocardia hispaniensis]|uniref:Sporulation protein YtfJ n=1 Tax=Pseudonocardia hispaniensis TaxID=904933 RepID=A0ABW1J0T2_9PSEU
MSSLTPTEQTPPQRAASDVVAIVAERLGRDQVFGPPIEKNGTTVVPVARVRAGGGIGGRRVSHLAGSSGAGVVARPVGAFSIGADGTVSWHPAVDVNKIILGGQVLVGLVAVAATRRRLRRRRRHDATS